MTATPHRTLYYNQIIGFKRKRVKVMPKQLAKEITKYTRIHAYKSTRIYTYIYIISIQYHLTQIYKRIVVGLVGGKFHSKIAGLCYKL